MPSFPKWIRQVKIKMILIVFFILVHPQEPKLIFFTFPGKNKFVSSFPDNGAKKMLFLRIALGSQNNVRHPKFIIFSFKFLFYLQLEMKLQYPNDLENTEVVSLPLSFIDNQEMESRLIANKIDKQIKVSNANKCYLIRNRRNVKCMS
jgi:hypothetical protein